MRSVMQGESEGHSKTCTEHHGEIQKRKRTLHHSPSEKSFGGNNRLAEPSGSVKMSKCKTESRQGSIPPPSSRHQELYHIHLGFNSDCKTPSGVLGVLQVKLAPGRWRGKKEKKGAGHGLAMQQVKCARKLTWEACPPAQRTASPTRPAES